MLALYHRSQVEWALWRLKTGVRSKRKPPPEFLDRVRRLYRGDHPAAAELRLQEESVTAVFSPMETVMLWLALELEEIGVLTFTPLTESLNLRSSITQALSKCTASGLDPLALVVIPSNSGSPYAPASSPQLAEFILSPFSRVSEATKKFTSYKIVVLPLQRSAEDLAGFLEEAPITKRGPISRSS